MKHVYTIKNVLLQHRRNLLCKRQKENYCLGRLPRCFTSQHVERGEREVADLFTRPNACVLEFGGGSGAVSMIIQKHLNNPSNHVVIQPRDGVGLENPLFGGFSTLIKNKEACKSSFQIIDHVLKAGEGKRIMNLVSKPFDTIIADCEGCLLGEYEKNPELFRKVNMIQVERDDIVLNTERYDKLFKTLNLKKIHTGLGCDTECVTEVWVRSKV